MMRRHAMDPDLPPLALCGAGPDSSGHVHTVPTEADVDCADCLEALDLHVCGIDAVDLRCAECVWLAGTDAVMALRLA